MSLRCRRGWLALVPLLVVITFERLAELVVSQRHAKDSLNER